MKNTKKIIFIHLLNDYSGSPKVLSQVIKTVKKNGCDLELYTGGNSEGLLSNLTKKHYVYFYKRFENKYLTLLSYIFSQFHLFFKLLKYKNEDIIIYINTMLPFGAALAGKFINKPVYYHIHETSLKPKILKKFLRLIINKTASKIIFVSNSLKNSESFEKILQEVIYNAIPENLLKEAEKHKYSYLHNGFFNVLMVCSLKEYKGINEFLEIAYLCEKYKKINFILVLNAEKDQIESYFKDKKLSKNIKVYSKQDNLISFYKSSSLVLNLSRIDQWIETFGLTIIEALAFGIPVIVPPVGGPAEIISNGKEGFLISSYETRTIAKKIIELSKNKEICITLSENAKKRIKDFKEEKFEEKIKKLLCN